MATPEYAPPAPPNALRAPAGQTNGGAPEIVVHGLRERPRGWTAWLSTTDHKKIGLLYIYTTFLFFIMGGVEALLMRLQLAHANNTLLEPHTYNALLTLHGSTMIFVFVVPVLLGFGNYLVPLMIGARDMAIPRLNALSYWLFLFGGIAFYASVFFTPPTAGWTSYAPLSDNAFLPDGGIDAWIFMIHLTGLSSLLGAINFTATIHNMRAKGMSWGRMPLFVWTILITSYLLILALPVVAAAVTMLLTDRHFGTAFFDNTGGGDPLLWQHLFWFFGHPEVYIMALPAFGMISEVLPVFARKPIFGYKAIAASTAGIALLWMLVWGPHLFPPPPPEEGLAGFMLSSGLGKTSFCLMFIGFHGTFLVQHSLGLEGMPRRIYWYPPHGNWQTLNLISTIGSFILATGVLVTVVNVLLSLRSGRKAGNDPWQANTLEWFAQSPPPENNFDIVPRIRSVEPMKDIRRDVARRTGRSAETVSQPVTTGAT